jgi:hypothetical protein
VIALPHHQMAYHSVSLHRLFSYAGLEVVDMLERPTDDDVFGQIIIPTSFPSKVAMLLSRVFGHGYLLVGIARNPLR